jgi:flagellar L-ring protein precursor FlgH
VSTLTTTVSVRVIDVLANGTMVVEGTKNLVVNSEHQTIVVRGLVRPADLTTANTVLSTQVGNLEVRVDGKGVVNDAIKRPFWLYRVLLGLLPF